MPLFILALAVMLFRPPDLNFYDLDRIAFVLLIFVMLLRIFLRRDHIRFSRPVFLPMFALTLLAFAAAISRPYEPQVWSVFAAKWLVPLTMFWLAGYIFQDNRSQKKLEIFFWVVLAYLSIIAVLFLLNERAFIFPRYILNESLGIHINRARGPFLQAVANGVAINLLALLALDSFRRRRLPKWLALSFFITVPIAILATKTRAVWLSFALSVVILMFASNRRTRTVCWLLMASTVAVACIAFSNSDQNESSSINSRLQAASPVEFRWALYQIGWKMFWEKPLLGWPAAEIQPQIERQMDEFHQESFYFHNTFLEVAVAYGMVGLGFYLWIFADLIRLHKLRGRQIGFGDPQVFDAEFRRLWPLLVLVYGLNACFVVMNYQFVNSVFFTLAGILAAQNHRLPGKLRLRGAV